MRCKQVEAIKTAGAAVDDEAGASHTFSAKDGAWVAPEASRGAVLSKAGDGIWYLATDGGSPTCFAQGGALSRPSMPPVLTRVKKHCR